MKKEEKNIKALYKVDANDVKLKLGELENNKNIEIFPKENEGQTVEKNVILSKKKNPVIG